MALNVGAQFTVTAGVQGQAQVNALHQSIQQVGRAGQVSAAQTAAAFRILPAQFTDIATQLAGGQNPFLILLQQGGQIKDQFGGFGATFRAFASVLTPARLAIGGIASGVGVLGLAYFQAEKEANNFAKTVALTGNAANVSYDKFLKLSKQLSESGGGSIGNAKDLFSGALGTGVFGSQSIQPVVQAMAQVQKLSGQTADAVVKDFAAMGGGVAKWAADHNRLYGYLTLDQFKYIKALERAGKAEEAMAYNAKLLSTELESRKPQLGTLETLWKNLGNAASGAWDKMLNIGRPDTLEQQLEAQGKAVAKLQQSLEDSKNSGIGQLGMGERERELKRERDKLEALQDQQRELTILTRKQNELSAAEKKRVEEEASGLNSRKRDAGLDRQVIDFGVETNTRLAEAERLQNAMDAMRAKGLVSEKEFLRESVALGKQKLDAEIAALQFEATIAARRSATDAADEMAKANKVQQIQTQIAELQQRKLTLEQKGELDAGVSDDRKAKAVRDYAAELKQANEMLALQRQAVNMTETEYQILVATRQRDYDLQQKTKDMLPSEAEAYIAAARAAGQLADGITRVNAEQEKSAATGFKKGLKELDDQINNQAKNMQTALVGAFNKSADALTDFVMTGKLEFGDFARSIIRDLTNMIIKQTLFNALKSSMGFMGFADGGAFGTGTQKFAKGDVFDSPTLFKFAAGGAMRNGVMGEAGPEAIMPLKRGADGKLGVVAAGAGGGGGDVYNITVPVSVDSSGQAEATSPGGAAGLGKAIAAAVRTELINQKRPGGMLAAA